MSAVITNLSSFPVWKTITLGKYSSLDEYLKAMKSTGIEILFASKANASCFCENPFLFAEPDTEIDLILCSVSQLGFSEGWVDYSDILAKAQELGLNLCPNEAGFALRLQYADQPFDETIHIGMAAMMNCIDRQPYHAYVMHEFRGTLTFCFQPLTTNDPSCRTFSLNSTFVFVKPR